MTRLRYSLTEEGVTASKKLLHVLVMNVRQPALAVNHRHERSTGMASVDSEIRSKHSATSDHEHSSSTGTATFEKLLVFPQLCFNFVVGNVGI